MQYFSYVFMLMILQACVPPMVQSNGHIEANKQVSQLKQGETTRDEVQKLLGTPSISNNFGAETWYYVQNRKESIAFLNPDITKQNVVRIVFDDQGVIDKIEQYDLNDRKEIVLSEDATPTEGQELGFFEQILGNVGRFNGGAAGGAGLGGMGGRSGPTTGGMGGGGQW